MKEDRPVGRPEHQVTEETKKLVEDLVCSGFTQVDVADHLDIDEKTLCKHYRNELSKTKRFKTMILANGLYKDAVEGNAQAREFWLKCQARWSYAKAQEDKEKDDKHVALLEKIIDKL